MNPREVEERRQAAKFVSLPQGHETLVKAGISSTNLMVNNDIRDTGDVNVIAYEDENVLTKKVKTYARTLTHNFVPRYIRVSGRGGVYMCGLAEADYVFVTRRESTIDEKGSWTYIWRGMVMGGYILRVGRTSYMYMSTSDTITGAPYVKSAIASYAVVGMRDYYYNDPTNIKNLELHFGNKYKNRRPTEKDLKRLRNLPSSKITGMHHTHYNVSEMLEALMHDDEIELDQVVTSISLMENATQAFASGTLGWYYSLQPALRKIVSRADMWSKTTVEDWAKSAKHASRFMKAMQNCIEADLRQVFEIDVLANRGVGSIDWEAEKDHRVKPDVVDIPYTEVYQEAVKIFRRAANEGRRPPSMSWEKYWKSRWQFTPTGSVHSQHDDDAQWIFKDRTLRNKFMTLIRMPNDTPIDFFLDKFPETHAWSSIKWEWAKLRAIYGVDLATFVLTNFGMYMCEEVLPGDFPVGSKSNDNYVKSAVEGVLDGNSPYAFDFADFNAQHPTHAMKAVIHAFRDAYGQFLTDEQVKAIDWIFAAHDNVYVHDNMGLHEVYKSMGTLLSGHRLTTFINSVLNKIYSRKLIEGIKRTIVSVHNGDDILFGIRKISECATMRRNAMKYNIRAQQAKCAAFSIAEFLRVDHTRPGNGQYLSRGLATLVHSRIESVGATNISDAIEANETRLLEAVDRGFSTKAAIVLRYLYNKRVSGIFNHTTEDAYIITGTHRALGGLTLAKNALTNYTITDAVVSEELIDEIKNVELPGVQAFADAVTSRLDLPEKREQINKAIMQSTLRMAMSRRVGKHITKDEHNRESLIMVGLYKCFKDLRAKSLLGQAKMAGVVLSMTSDDERIELLKMTLSKVEDPIKWLSILV